MLSAILRSLRGQGLRAELLRGGLGSIVIKVLATGLALLVAVLLARVLGPEQYGVYAYVFALVALLTIPAEFGLPTLVVRETSKAHAGKKWGEMLGLWRWASFTAASLSVFLIAIGAVLAWRGSSRFTDVQLIAFGFGLATVPLVSLGNLRGAALRGLRRIVIGQVPEAILRPALIAILVVLATRLGWTESPNAADAAGIHAIAVAIAFAVGAGLLVRATPPAVKQGPQPIYHGSDWLKAATPMAFLAGMHYVNNQTDILVLGLFRPAEEVGIYRIVVQGGMLVTFGFHVVCTTVGPHFARLHTEGDSNKLQRVVTTSSIASFVLILPVALVLTFFGEEILRFVFGPQYASGYIALSFLAIGKLIGVGLFGCAALLLNMTGYERETARGVAIAAGGNVLLNFALIPPFGMSGAAAATALTLVFWHVLLWHVARRRIHIDSSPLSAIRSGVK